MATGESHPDIYIGRPEDRTSPPPCSLHGRQSFSSGLTMIPSGMTSDPDVRPFMPWTDYNPFLGLIGLAPLHLACIGAALFGAVCVTLWRRRNTMTPP
jgi:hypothetical protein